MNILMGKMWDVYTTKHDFYRVNFNCVENFKNKRNASHPVASQTIETLRLAMARISARKLDQQGKLLIERRKINDDWKIVNSTNKKAIHMVCSSC